EVLSLASDTLTFVPVMGLDVAAKTLLRIWNTIDLVEANRRSCLDLAFRCATILYSIRQEIIKAGHSVAQSLEDPIEKLTEAFYGIERFINTQSSRPFLIRYLRQDEDLRSLRICDQNLADALSLFKISIQMRILALAALQDYHPGEGTKKGKGAEASLNTNQDLAAGLTAIRVSQSFIMLGSLIMPDNANSSHPVVSLPFSHEIA
ncbi:hypothetical protein M422DRAFT_184803, partial [Sphaerobolus stellatus SS14]